MPPNRMLDLKHENGLHVGNTTRIDLHYHANVYGLSRRLRRKRVRLTRRIVADGGLACLASTEHSYKNPLEAYHHLLEVAEGGCTHVLPGVEAVSSENVEVIFLFRDEDHLRKGLGLLPSFGWSCRDAARIAAELDCITSIPHPFHICRSAAGNVLSSDAYAALLNMVDYVEIHNSSALTISCRLFGPMTRSLFRRSLHKLHATLDLPPEKRGRGLGWAIGSDAHFPQEQFIVGETGQQLCEGETYFDMLRRRIRFMPYGMVSLFEQGLSNDMSLLRNCRSAMQEGIIKKYCKTLFQAGVYATALPFISAAPAFLTKIR